MPPHTSRNAQHLPWREDMESSHSDHENPPTPIDGVTRRAAIVFHPSPPFPLEDSVDAFKEEAGK